MYTFTKNIKIFSLSLIILGALGLGYGFYTAPNSVEEAKAMVSNSHGLEEKNDSHDNNKDHAISEDLHELDDLSLLSGISSYPARVKCAVLSSHTIESAIKNEQNIISTE